MPGATRRMDTILRHSSDDARRRRVHPAVSAARPAKGLSPHLPLRPARQRRAQNQRRARPGTARSAAGDGRGRAGRGIRSPAAVSLLRRPHDRPRDVRALDPAARPATADVLSRKELVVTRHGISGLVIAALLRSTISCGPPVPKWQTSGRFGPRLLPILVLSRAEACRTKRSTPPIAPSMATFPTRPVH